MQHILNNAKAASAVLKNVPAVKRTAAIVRIAELIDSSHQKIIAANAADLADADTNGLSAAMKDRLRLNESRLKSLSASVREIANQSDPIGEVLAGGIRPNGIEIVKIRVPLGVVGIIYESRPNVTVDCAALCLRSGNVALLRGGKEAVHSNKVLAEIISQALKDSHLPECAVTLLDDPDRTKMLAMIQAVGYVDLVIPRGGEGLISFVSKNARVPVIKHDKGLCAIFVDESADVKMALDIVRNAKVSRPSACNAVETLLIHEKIAESVLPMMAQHMPEVQLLGCERSCEILDIPSAKEAWSVEHLDFILSVRVVSSIDMAMEHIAQYGSAHSEAIVTESYSNAERFLNEVDSACVYVNASTRFTDGGEFGFGAEVGISTEKLHSRGPMGAFDLTTTKYKIYGSGQIR